MITFQHPLPELVQKRISVRNYQPLPLARDSEKILADFLQQNTRAPFGPDARFCLLKTSSDDEDLAKLGTYGIISGARAFLAGAIHTGPLDLEAFGYLMETAILLATDLGLQTCWLGGTFSRSSFARRINLAAGESMPAISAIGYGKNTSGLVDKMIRWGASSHTRKKWEELFYFSDFSTNLNLSQAGDFGIALEMLRLAPSASNRQPWRVVMQKGQPTRLHFFISRNSGYQKTLQVLQLADLQRIDLGIAMNHFELACEYLAMPGHWHFSAPEISLPANTDYIASWLAEI